MRTLSLAVLLACVAFALIGYRERQKRVSQEIREKVHSIQRDWQWVSQPSASVLPPPLAEALEHDTEDELDVSECHLTPALRGQLGNLRRVRWLRLSPEVASEDLQWIGQLTQLRGLSLAGSQLDGADLSELQHLQSLCWLNLSFAKISDRGFLKFPRLAKLQWLMLAGDQVNDEYLVHLSELQLPALADVELVGASVSDTGLAHSCSTYNLESLDLLNCRRISGNSIRALCKMTNLQVLAVGGTGLSPDYTVTPRIAELRSLLPSCRIDHGD